MAALAAALAVAACGGGGASGGRPGAGTAGGQGFTQAPQDAKATITVWVDADRATVVEAFRKANPTVTVKAETYDGSANGSNSFRTKVQLFDRAGSGWPDVVFSTQNNDAAWAGRSNAGKAPFAAPLDQGLVPSATLGGFTPGALAPCTVGGHTYCLRNDLAQVVLWYDKSLLDRFGYRLPTTWQEYQALGERVGREHPGYIVGTAGDPWTPETYFWSGRCGANQVTGPAEVTVNTSSKECTRVAAMLDSLRSAGTVPVVSVFAPEFVGKYAGKVLMLPGPAWYAGAIFDNPQALNVPPRRLGVAAPLPWQGEQPVTGNVGGGTWFVSSHSRNLAAATRFVEFATTSDDYQVARAPGYPAYAPAAAKWIAKQEAGGYYATKLTAITTAGAQIWPGWGAPSFSQEAVWAKTITPAVAGGRRLVDLMADWQTAIANQARVNGYRVN